MKFHTLPIIRYYVTILVFLIFLILPSSFVTLGFVPSLFSAADRTTWIIFSVSLLILSLAFIHFAFWEKCFAYIVVTEKEIIWKCPFRKSISITRKDCLRVGLEYENTTLPIKYPYIFFTSTNYPREEDPFIGKIRCKPGIIKFRYTKPLADYVIKEFAPITNYALCSYHRANK